MDQNPYAAPSADLVGTSELSNAEETRNKYLKHEASVKSAGLFYYFGGFISFLAGLFILLGTVLDPAEFAGSRGLFFGLGLFYAIMGSLALYGGRKLRTLSVRARVPTAIVSGIGLLGIPIGTLINGYILYLVFSEKGNVVLSEEYKHVIDSTPTIKYKTPLYIWILLAIILGLVLFAIFASSS